MSEDEATNIRMQLLELASESHNSACADCGERDPQWASANLGIFICIVCAGIHRNLGVHISRVRSLMLDIWRPDELEIMQRIGNKRSNEKWEGALREFSPIRVSDSVVLREQWIKAKYVRRLYLKTDDAQTAQPMEFPYMEGWLIKKGVVVQNWRKRVFKLTGSTLLYYKGLKESSPKGIINIVEATRTPDCLPEVVPDHPHCFAVNTPNRDYLICAETGEMMYDWIQILRTARRYFSAPSSFGFTNKARDVTHVEQVTTALSRFATQKRKVAGKSFDNCLLGAQVVDMLIHMFRLDSRQEGVLLGQSLVDKGTIHPCVPEPFADGDKAYHL